MQGSPRSPYRSFEHHREVLADKADIALRQLEYRADPHRFALPIRRPMPQTSLTGSSAISFRCRCGQDKSTTPPVCRGHCFAAWLASFAGFGLGDANAQRQMGTLQYRGADFAAKIGQISAMTHTADIAKGLIDTVNFAARVSSSVVAITRLDMSAYSS